MTGAFHVTYCEHRPITFHLTQKSPQSVINATFKTRRRHLSSVSVSAVLIYHPTVPEPKHYLTHHDRELQGSSNTLNVHKDLF